MTGDLMAFSMAGRRLIQSQFCRSFMRRFGVVSSCAALLLFALFAGSDSAWANFPTGNSYTYPLGLDRDGGLTLQEMQYSWAHYHYFYVGIYVSGNNRGSQPYLTPQWVSAVDDVGFGFLPIDISWQAPSGCGDQAGLARMSLDPTTAYNEGVQSAVDASAAAANLGLPRPTIIYSDIEGYHTTNASCKTAVLEYEHGWLNQMKLYEGRAAGIYGSSSGTDMQSFATEPNPPDDIWFAEWGCSDNQPCVSVWNTSFIQPTSWATQPPYGRVHQFANWPCMDQVNHSDCVLFDSTWREIDQNCAWGLVAGKGWAQDPAFPNCPGTHP